MTAASRFGVFLYPEEIVLRGAEGLVDDLRDHGIGAVSMAVVYHRARRLFPRYQSVSLTRLGEYALGTPRTESVRSVVTPSSPETSAALRRFRDLCREADIEFRAWVVLLHQETSAVPMLASTYADGTAMAHAICPSRPGTADLAADLIGEIESDLAPDAYDLEAAMHSGWEPDYGLTLAQDGRTRAHNLLATCTCEACGGLLVAHGLDPDVVRQAVDAAAWSGEPLPPVLASGLRSVRAIGPERVAASVAAATGRPRRLLMFGSPSDLAWQGATDQLVQLYGSALIGVGELPAVRCLQRWRRHRDALAGPLDASVNWAATSPGEPSRAVEQLLASGANRVFLYNYSLLPHAAMDEILSAVLAAGRAGGGDLP